jgi:hypothetical protein
MGHALMENRNGLIVDFELTEATGYAERDAAIAMLDRQRRRRRKGPKLRRITLAAAAAYDAREFVKRCRERRVTPHVAQKKHSAIDGRTTSHPGPLGGSRGGRTDRAGGQRLGGGAPAGADRAGRQQPLGGDRPAGGARTPVGDGCLGNRDRAG